MQKTVVELEAYVLPDDHKVYKCFPGKTYRFYNAVREAHAVFLDIRGLDKLPDDPSNWEEEVVLSVIADDRWQRELASRERGNKPTSSEGVGRTDKRNWRFLRHLLLEAKKGDLIVVPVDGYTKDVLIGELTTDAGDIRQYRAKDGQDEFVYVGRPVTWRGKTEKRFLSKELIDLLHSQSAFFAIPLHLHEELYRIAYKNFIFRNHYVSTFQTSKLKFTAEDTAVVSTWFNGFEALRDALERQEVEAIAKKTFYELGLLKISDTNSAEVTININSPGAFAIRSTTAFAFALMAMLPLAACSPEEVIDNDVIVELKVIGTVDPKDCSLPVEKAIKSYATTLGYDRLKQSCELAKRAQDDATVKTNARLKSRAGKSN